MTAYRKLFERSAPDHPLTSMKVELLLFVAECRVLTVPQLAGLSGRSESAVRRHMCDLYHLELVERAGVNRSSLAKPGTPNTENLLWGRAPTIYTLTRRGGETLIKARLLDRIPDIPDYGPLNSEFLAHETEVRDVRVWLEKCKRKGQGFVAEWRDWTDAHIGTARPDAWFVHQLETASLVGLVETDRKTERKPSEWQKKVADYGKLFEGDAIKEATGKKHARVIVIAPDGARREKIASVVQGPWAGKFYIAEAGALGRADLESPIWRVPGKPVLQALVSPGQP